MLISSMIFVSISFWVNKEINGRLGLQIWKLENLFSLIGIGGHALSLNSSSLVEEEQFTLYFLVVTIWFLFLRKTCQHAKPCDTSTQFKSFARTCNMLPSSLSFEKCDNSTRKWPQAEVTTQVFAIFMVLVTGKIVRSWHRSGVNWAHLVDIAKWMEQGDASILFGAHLLSLTAAVVISWWLVLQQTPRNVMQKACACSLTLSGLLIMAYTVRAKDTGMGHDDNISIKLAQLVYSTLGFTTLSAIVFTPWFISFFGKDVAKDGFDRALTVKFQESLNFIGKVIISCWCLLQLLLQQPVNSVPMVILLVQLICCLIFFNLTGSTYSLWLKVSHRYYPVSWITYLC